MIFLGLCRQDRTKKCSQKGVYRQIVSHVIEPELIKILHGNTVRNRNWNDFGTGIRVHAASQSRLFLYTHSLYMYAVIFV